MVFALTEIGELLYMCLEKIVPWIAFNFRKTIKAYIGIQCISLQLAQLKGLSLCMMVASSG